MKSLTDEGWYRAVSGLGVIVHICLPLEGNPDNFWGVYMTLERWK